MPYEVLKSRGKKEGYYVVNKDTRRKHSKDPLPKSRAEAQMRALYASESGYKMRGGGDEDDELARLFANAGLDDEPVERPRGPAPRPKKKRGKKKGRKSPEPKILPRKRKHSEMSGRGMHGGRAAQQQGLPLPPQPPPPPPPEEEVDPLEQDMLEAGLLVELEEDLASLEHGVDAIEQFDLEELRTFARFVGHIVTMRRAQLVDLRPPNALPEAWDAVLDQFEGYTEEVGLQTIQLNARGLIRRMAMTCIVALENIMEMLGYVFPDEDDDEQDDQQPPPPPPILGQGKMTGGGNFTRSLDAILSEERSKAISYGKPAALTRELNAELKKVRDNAKKRLRASKSYAMVSSAIDTHTGGLVRLPRTYPFDIQSLDRINRFIDLLVAQIRNSEDEGMPSLSSLNRYIQDIKDVLLAKRSAVVDAIEETRALISRYNAYSSSSSVRDVVPKAPRNGIPFIPKGSEDAITFEEIKEGMPMVDFHDRFRRGQYFKESTFNSLRGRDPFDRQRINPRSVKQYRAEIVETTENPMRGRGKSAYDPTFGHLPGYFFEY